VVTRRQWRDWYRRFGDWLPYEQVRVGVLGAMSGCLLLLIPATPVITVVLGCSLVAVGFASIVRGVSGRRAARRERLRLRDARWHPHAQVPFAPGPSGSGRSDPSGGRQEAAARTAAAIGLAFGVVLLVAGVVTTSHWWSVGLMGVGAGFVVEAGVRARRRRSMEG
jgi:uncharacterized membrane protein HdeD (DUF308 family)